MSLHKESAESRFRTAFERLKSNCPVVLPLGTPVSQNNVALEAGTDATALRKSRYPTLVKDIQDFVRERDSHELAAREQRAKSQQTREEDAHRADRMEKERDTAQAKLNALQDKLLEALAKVDVLQIQLNDYLPPPSPLRG